MDEEAARLAVMAHARRRETKFDELLARGTNGGKRVPPSRMLPEACWKGGRHLRVESLRAQLRYDRQEHRMNTVVLTISLWALLAPPGSLIAEDSESAFDVYWISRYGAVSWEDERAHLDNFAIELQFNPDLIGYIVVNAGMISCRGEAQARAVRAKRYLVEVRGVPWNRIIWRDIGYREALQTTLWLVPRGRPPLYHPEYQPATKGYVIKECGAKSRRPSKSGKP